MHPQYFLCTPPPLFGPLAKGYSTQQSQESITVALTQPTAVAAWSLCTLRTQFVFNDIKSCLALRILFLQSSAEIYDAGFSDANYVIIFDGQIYLLQSQNQLQTFLFLQNYFCLSAFFVNMSGVANAKTSITFKNNYSEIIMVIRQRRTQQ